MTVNELIKKHALKCAEGSGLLKAENEFRAESENHLTMEWMKISMAELSVELLETVKESARLEVRHDPGVYVGMKEAHRNYGLSINKALEELRKISLAPEEKS